MGVLVSASWCRKLSFPQFLCQVGVAGRVERCLILCTAVSHPQTVFILEARSLSAFGRILHENVGRVPGIALARAQPL